jgi:peptide/nickel transport system permease protein
VLPAATLGISLGAQNARLVRTTLLETLNQDFVRAARARGLPWHIVILKYGLGNALLPLLTVVMLQIPHLMGGVLVIETLFSWPGMGQLAVSALSSRDMPLVQASVLFIAALVVGTNLLADVLYARLDPRIRDV